MLNKRNPWLYTLEVLQEHEDWINEKQLLQEVRKLYPKADLSPVVRRLKKTANIGHMQGKYIWYEPSDLTKQVQECLDRGNDW